MRIIRGTLTALALATALAGCATYPYGTYGYNYPPTYYGGSYYSYSYPAYSYRYAPVYQPYYRDSNSSPAGGGGNG